MSPPAIARNVRRVVKYTLRAFVDLELASGLVLLNCAFHVKRSHRWVQLPSRSFEADDGTVRWVSTVDFVDAATRARFQKIALEALREHFPELQQQQEEATMRGHDEHA